MLGSSTMGGKESSQTDGNGGTEQPLKCLVVGAGNRGKGYADFSSHFPKQLKVVGVADPNDVRRNRMVETFSISPEFTFTDWKEAAKKEKFADFVIVATVDRDHKEPTVAFAQLGYDILLEKPMAVTEEDCKEIVSVCEASKVTLAVCHVLRYTPWVLKIKEMIDEGLVGEIVNIRHTEPVGYWHFAHSFVRGNWRNESTSTFSLLAKCCHDLDLIDCWMSPHKCTQVSSFGHLSHFNKENKPKNATSRCMDCPVEQSCAYSAKRLYLDMVKSGHKGFPVSAVSDVVDIENVSEALKTGPYGKCVYDSDNDVVSHQVVNMQYDSGATVSMSMVGFTKKICAREVKIYGTKGEISYEDGWSHVELFDFLTENTLRHPVLKDNQPKVLAGHGGADFHLMKSFVDALSNTTSDHSTPLTGPRETLQSHLLVFAAEKARKENRVVHINPDGSFD